MCVCVYVYIHASNIVTSPCCRTRQKRLAGIKSLHVYALALYVDQKGIQSLLRDAIGHRDEESVCRDDTLYTKVIQSTDVEKVLRLVISSNLVKRKAFLKALDERLQPVVRGTHSEKTLATFCSMFDTVSFRKGLDVTFFFQPGGDMVTKADGKELGRLHDAQFSKEILNIYLGKDPVSLQAKHHFGRGIYTIVTKKKISH